MGKGSKVTELNLEAGNPTIADALARLKNALPTLKGQGYKAVILIHGYGSSGVGGGIKPAVRKTLADKSFSGVVRDFAGGEEWSSRKKSILNICPAVGDHDRHIAGNPGITVVVLR